MRGREGPAIAAADRARSRASAERSWQRFTEGRVPDDVRPDVLASWRRSEQVPLSLDRAPVRPDAPDRWRDSPAGRAHAVIANELRTVALDQDFVAAATDADGTITWSAGGRTMRRRAEQVAFVPGGRWGEDAVGTNALGLALAQDRPATVWSAEHYAPIVHDWVCYSAPFHDPVTGAVAGVVDLSTTWRRAHPLALTTVTALARVLDQALATTPAGLAAAATPVAVRSLRLRLLGTGSGEVGLGGTPLVLPPRQIELLGVLALSPRGLTLDALHERLHGERSTSPVTTKAEVSHLRRRLGDRLASRPYRLVGPVDADHVEVLEALADGRLDRALDLYRGPLLPASEAPALVEHRHLVDAAVHNAAVATGGTAQLARLARAAPHDGHVHELLVARLGDGDPRRALAQAALDALER